MLPPAQKKPFAPRSTTARSVASAAAAIDCRLQFFHHLRAERIARGRIVQGQEQEAALAQLTQIGHEGISNNCHSERSEESAFASNKKQIPRPSASE